jgi:hypothetical protein
VYNEYFGRLVGVIEPLVRAWDQMKLGFSDSVGHHESRNATFKDLGFEFTQNSLHCYCILAACQTPTFKQANRYTSFSGHSGNAKSMQQNKKLPIIDILPFP